MFSKVILVSGFAIALSSVALAETSPKFQAISKQLVVSAEAAQVEEKSDDAMVLYERALVANPSNVDALVGLARTHEILGSVGKGLKYYRQALEIEPDDTSALEGQAVAFIKRDMTDRAKDNLDKLVKLCPEGCASLSIVEAAIADYDAKTAAKNDNADTPNPKS
ncbi:tetratricopeptide repeat protein [Kordiimonas pumila]|uniref:Tetratricopeptide repeat protein n=1 Tax=Kordiimonas pumila TaxID=2161677 RepID=A0ABV7D1Q2_9PROT|nr:hypothetical protein [Kordiimonas pumila]